MSKWRWIVPAAALVIVIAAAAFLYPRLAVRYAPDNEPAPQKEQTAVTAAETEDSEPAAEKAPDFTVLDADGNPVQLSDYIGKPVVINFWASWCPPCREELPSFDKLYAEYGDRVTFLMVNLTYGEGDVEADVNGFLAEEGYTFPVFYDTEGDAAAAYAIEYIPVTVFVRADGTLAAQQVGAMQERIIRSYLDDLLEE